MFTGIIEEIGTVISRDGNLSIKAKKILSDIHIGDSICVNGVCLTVVKFDSDSFCVDVMAESYRCTNLGELKQGDKVNLERAMPANGRFGGHIVSGHVDGTGKITQIKDEGIAIVYSISADKSLLKYIINKGSITIDGISLTVCYICDDFFRVSVIPHTQRETTLALKKVGSTVNLETDIIAGYVEKLIETKSESKVDVDFLQKCGFL